MGWGNGAGKKEVLDPAGSGLVHGIPPPPFFRAHFPPEIAKDARNFETALLCFICINQKPKDFDPPIERPQTTKKGAGVAEIAGGKGRRRPKKAAFAGK